MLFGGMPSMGYEHTLGKKDKIEFQLLNFILLSNSLIISV